MIPARPKVDYIPNANAVKSFAILEEPNSSSRPQMEDKSLVIDCFLESCPKSLIFAIFDGHGGAEVSSSLQKMMPSLLRKMAPQFKRSVFQLLEQSFITADSELSKAKLESGSTGTVGLILIEDSRRMLYVGHVGDSSLYLFDDKGAEKLTPEHRADNQSEVKRVSQEGGKIMSNRLGGILAVTRAFGDFHLKKVGLTAKPQLHRVELRLSHKYAVMASDGLWDFIDPAEVRKIVREQEDPDSIANRLCRTALQQGSVDNISIIVLRL